MEVIQAAEKKILNYQVQLKKFDLSESTIIGMLNNKNQIKKLNSEYNTQVKKLMKNVDAKSILNSDET